MNKEQFLTQLKKQLSGIPKKEVDDMLYDYEEHFTSAAAKGKSEEEIVNSLGSVKSIAATIKADYYIDNADGSFKPKDIISAVFAAAALGFFNIVFVLGPFTGIASIIFALWAVSFSFLFSGFIGAFLYTIAAVFSSAVFPLLAFQGLSFITIFFGLLTLGMTGLFMGIGCFYLTRLFFKLTVSYLKWNLNFVTTRRL